MIHRSFGELAGKFFTRNGDSVLDVAWLVSFCGCVPGRELRKVKVRPDSLEKPTTCHERLREAEKVI